jgi:hypothetical protein
MQAAKWQRRYLLAEVGVAYQLRRSDAGQGVQPEEPPLHRKPALGRAQPADRPPFPGQTSMDLSSYPHFLQRDASEQRRVHAQLRLRGGAWRRPQPPRWPRTSPPCAVCRCR